jgi:hypothetical protein
MTWLMFRKYCSECAFDIQPFLGPVAAVKILLSRMTEAVVNAVDTHLFLGKAVAK